MYPIIKKRLSDIKPPGSTLIFIMLLVTATIFSCQAQKTGKWGDQKNGCYLNPILPGDFQNTDVIRVYDTYYYISATKELSPGMMILSSKDLVNWTIAGHAINDITQINSRYNYDHMQGASRGVWAGAIRYHNNRFYIYFTDPDYGLYMTTAVKAEGPWSPLLHIKAAAGLDDPCPFWDDDDKAYLVMTNFSDAYKIRLYRMSADGEKLLDTGTVVYQGRGSEANKLYKINGYYYHFYSEVTAEGRIPFMARAKTVTGPYTERRQLIHAAEAEPNQGGLVQTVAGSWYFVTHHGNAYWSGREASLLPITWKDGWPLWGQAGADGIGNMVWSAKIPTPQISHPILQTSDDFSSSKMSPQWEWYYQPRAGNWSLTERPGFLRLHACKPLQPGKISKITNVLTQRPFRTDSNVATVKFDISGMADNQESGLAIFGKTEGSIKITKSAKQLNVVNKSANMPISPATSMVWLRASWNKMGVARFYFSTDGQAFTPLGEIYQISNFGNYLGAKIGIYTVNNLSDSGYVDVDSFNYVYQ